MERTEPIIATNTRYPKELHDALRKLAQEHKRSFNAEVMWALQRYVSQEEATDEATDRTDLLRADRAIH